MANKFESKHRHDEITSASRAEALGIAATRLGGYEVRPLALAGETAVHMHDDLSGGFPREVKTTVPAGHVQVEVVAPGDTTRLYDEAEQIASQPVEQKRAA